jgi:regulator of sigma E protease
MIMEMGLVAAVRNNSPAAAAHVLEGDKITKVELLLAANENQKEQVLFTTPEVFDPAKLPFDLEQAARKSPDKKMVRLTVLRSNPPNQAVQGGDAHRATGSITLEPVPWDESWTYEIERPDKLADPLSIPQLGVAYWINCRVAAVLPDSLAARAGIQPKDRIAEIRARIPGKRENDEEVTWTDWLKLESTGEDGQAVYNEWAYCSRTLRIGFDRPQIQVKISRAEGKLVQGDDGKDKVFDINEEYDYDWPSDEVGFATFMPDKINVKASSLLDALYLGANDTADWVQRIYLGMRNLVTRRINPVKTFGGPISIARAAFIKANDPIDLILFMAAISINLAIVNFLPIPLMDGGHMVLLIYEKIRGKPPSDGWKTILTYIGLVIILALMITAFSLDIARWLKWL